MGKILRATHEGELKLGDSILSCAVLNNGTRVLTATAVFKAFDRPRKGKSSESYRADQMPSFINANNLQPFINEQLKQWTEAIQYIDLNGTIRYGYNARVLRGLCKVYIDAKNANALHKSQERFIPIAEALLYSLADLGITALVDEATGYQLDRKKDALQTILKAYISEEFLPWQKRFPDIFYEELFRLNGWEYNVDGIKKRPSVIGTWTNILIYKRLPDGVLEELKKKTPRSASGRRTKKFHQSLSEDIGNPHLQKQITKVLTIFQLSNNMEEVWYHFQRLVDRESGQIFLPFYFDDLGYTVIPKEEPAPPKKELSKFDNALLTAINHNPHNEDEPQD